MKTIKAHFDGKRVILPDDIGETEPGEIILVFGALGELAWIQAQGQSLAKVWDNEEDGVYDSL